MQEASLWGKVLLYSTAIVNYAQPLNIITRYDHRVHEDYQLGEPPSQKNVVDLGSRIPWLSLETTLAPESPRFKMS